MVNKMPIRSSLNFFLKMIDKKKIETARKIVSNSICSTLIFMLILYTCIRVKRMKKARERERERIFCTIHVPFLYIRLQVFNKLVALATTGAAQKVEANTWGNLLLSTSSVSYLLSKFEALHRLLVMSLNIYTVLHV